MQERQEKEENKAYPLPLEEEAIEAARNLAGELTLEEATATDQLDERKLLFRLARRLWALRGVDEESYEEMLPAVCAFVGDVYGDSSEHPEEFAMYDDRWIAFVDCWFKVRYPEGRGPLEVAFQKAESEPVSVRRTYRSKSYVRFISMCYHLQCDRGDEPILLPVERVGALFGKGKMLGSRLISLARQAGLLVLASNSNRAARRARMFRFHIGGVTPCSGVRVA